MANLDDAEPDAVLRHLYTGHEIPREPASVAIGIKDVRAPRKDAGMIQGEVDSNSDCLVQNECVAVAEERKTFSKSL